MNRSMGRLPTLAVLAAALTLAGCADGGGTAARDALAAAAPITTSTNTAEGDASDQGGVIVPADSSGGDSQPLASYRLPGTDDLPEGSTVLIEVVQVKVQGEEMLLEVAITPEVPAGSAEPDEEWSLDDITERDFYQATFYDLQNMKEYGLMSWEYTYLASYSFGIDVAAGEAATWWGFFPSPPVDAETLKLQLASEHPLIDVAVQR